MGGESNFDNFTTGAFALTLSRVHQSQATEFPMTLVNLTPHAITLIAPSGEHHVIPPSGTVARVASTPGAVEAREGFPCLVASPTKFGEVTGLPAPAEGTVFVVSGMVGSALAGKGRTDVLVPGTGPNDGALRNEAGHIVGVTRLVAVA